jgi:hypothetical protein
LNWLNPRGSCCFVKLDSGTDVIVISNGQGRHLQFSSPLYQGRYGAGPIEKREGGMDVEMDKVHRKDLLWLELSRNPSRSRISLVL